MPNQGIDDAYDLGRFLWAQEGIYEQALAEIRRGCAFQPMLPVIPAECCH